MLPIHKIAREISRIENREPESFSSLAKVYSSQSLSRSFCVTGPGGVGKSSLLANLVPLIAEQGSKVAWLACDPSSPVTGGSLLGDRIRLSGEDLSDKIY